MHLFNKENIWSNPCSFLHTSSHPDKNNNSVNRIISKGKEREDPRRDSSKTSFQLESKSIPVFPHTIQQLQVSTFNSTYRINSTTRKLQQIQGSFCAGILQQLFPVYPSILHGRIKAPSALQCSRPLQHKQASSNSTQQKQHSTRQPAYTQPFQ